MRAPPGVRGWQGGGGGLWELSCVLWSLGWGKDSAPGRRCAVRARPPARVRRWSGDGPPRWGGDGPPRWGGGPGRSSEVGGSCLPSTRRDVLEKLRSRVRGRAAGEGQRGSPKQSRRGRSAVGPYPERRPLARGRRTEAGSGDNLGGGAVVPGAASRVRAGGAAPPGAGAERRARGPGSYLLGSRG